MTINLHEDTNLLTILRLAHLNAWNWNLKTRDLTMINTSDQETLGRISPLMAQEKVTVPNYPQVLIDRGIIKGNAIELVNEYTMMIYHAEDGQEVAFRLPFTNTDDETVWLQFRGVIYRDTDGNPDRGIGYYTDITNHLDNVLGNELDTIMHVELEKQRYMNMIKGLTLQYANVFLVNLLDDTYTTFRLNDMSNMMVRRQLESQTSFKDVLSYYIQEYVIEADREKMQCLVSTEMIRLMLKEKGYFHINYRSLRDNELVYCQASVALGNVNDDEVVLSFRNIDEEDRQKQSLRKESRQDTLTGLLNRRAFQSDVLREFLDGSTENIAFLFLDLDHFKDVNDTLGHAVGDEAIATTATRLCNVFRKSDIICRYGGDEFCVFISNIPIDTLKVKLDECLSALRSTYRKRDNFVNVTTSIGVAYAHSHTHADAKWMMEQADLALYEAKRKGRNQYIIKEYDVI